VNRLDPESQGAQGTDGRLAADPGTLHEDVKLAESEFLGLVGRVLGCRLGGERSLLLRSPKPKTTSRGPRQRVAAQVGDSHDGVVEGRLDKDVSFEDYLFFFLFLRLGQNDAPDYFFLFATVFRLPLRVRALVLVL